MSSGVHQAVDVVTQVFGFSSTSSNAKTRHIYLHVQLGGDEEVHVKLHSSKETKTQPFAFYL